MNLGDAIKKIRTDLNYTQEYVCSATGLTQGYYSTLENGNMPSVETLVKLSEAFGLPLFFLIWLATEKEDIPKYKSKWHNVIEPTMNTLLAGYLS